MTVARIAGAMGGAPGLVEDVGGIVELFRDAACGVRDWPEALDALARASGGHIGQLAVVDARGAMTLNLVSGISTDVIHAYYAARGDDPAVNPRTRAVIEAAAFRCVTDEDCITAAERDALPIFRGLFRQADVPYGAHIRLAAMPGYMSAVSMMRSQTQGPADRHAVQLIEAAAPGIASALHAGMTLGSAQDGTLAATAETLSGPAILLGRDLKIVSLSPLAEDMLRAGTHLRVRDGRLCAASVRTGHALDAAYRAVAAAPPAARVLRRVVLVAGDAEPLHADMCPLPARASGPLSEAAALLTVRAPRPRDAADVANVLTEAFGLTGAEAGIALLLADGLTLDAIAARRGSSPATVRSQLKALFDKTGTRRQTDLVLRLRTFH